VSSGEGVVFTPVFDSADEDELLLMVFGDEENSARSDGGHL
jgi:hypothetical protein